MKKKSKVVVEITVGVLIIAVIVVIAVLMGSGSHRKKYDRHMDSAQQYMDELEYERAIAEYEAAIVIKPNSMKAYQALAELYVQTGDYESAVEVLNRGIEQTESEELTVRLEEVLSAWEDKTAEGMAAQTGTGQLQETIQEETQELRDNGGENGAREETVYGEDGNYWVNEYDMTGNCVKTAYYNVDGMLDGYFIYEYDENGNYVKTTWCNADGTYYVEEYDTNGNCMQLTWYSADGEVTGVYDANGYPIDMQESIGENGVRQIRVNDLNGEGYWIDEYDENGNCVKTSWYFTEFVAEGELISYIIEEEDEDCIKFTRYMADGTLDWYVVEEHDGHGACVKLTCYSADGAVEWIEECGGEVARIVTNGVRWHRGMYYKFDIYDENGRKLRHGNHCAGATEIAYDVLYDRNGHYVDIVGYRGDGTILWEQEVDENGNSLNIISYNADGSVYMITPASH